MQKWEYCVLRSKEAGRGILSGLKRIVVYMDPEGKHKEEVISENYYIGGNGEQIEAARSRDYQVLAWLGEQGWEVFERNDQANWWYFKRPKE
jgi:hypothetical protein